MLDLNDLGNGFHPAISPIFGMALAEAGGVCLESQGHNVGVQLHVRGFFKSIFNLNWPPINEQSRRTWNDPEVATEHGAMGIAVLLAKKVTGYAVLERSRKGTGFDYWVGDKSTEPFQDKARLEISGIRKGTESDVKSRVRQKLKQTTRSASTLPAFAIVVEFSKPLTEVRKNERS